MTKAKVILCNSAQIRVIRGDLPSRQITRPRLQHAYAAHPRHILFCLRLPATTCCKHDQGKDYQNIFSHITHHSFVFIISSFEAAKVKKISKLDTFLSEIRNEYLPENVLVVLFRIGAETLFFANYRLKPRAIIPVFRNDLSRFSAEALHSRQYFH